MKSVCRSIFAVLLMGLSPLLADDAATSPEEAVRAAGRAYVKAFNARDAVAVGKLWAKNAVYTDRQTGAQTVGRDAIQAELSNGFAETPNLHLQFQAGSIRFIKPDVANVTATATLVAPDEAPSTVAVSAIFVNEEGHWLLDSVEESAVPAPETSRDALRSLEWLIGEWRDESEEITSMSSFRWSIGEAFLLRSFRAETPDGDAIGGTQVIGWDPLASHIRSWTFHSDGTFGEAIWSQNGSDWLIKSVQTLADGGTATGTYVLSPVDANSMTIKLIGHEVNGEPQPAGPVVRVVRVEAEKSEGGAK